MEMLEISHRNAASQDLFLTFILKKQHAVVRNKNDWDDTFELAYHKQIFDPATIQIFLVNEMAAAYIDIQPTENWIRISDIIIGLYDLRKETVQGIISYLFRRKQEEKKPLQVELLSDEFKIMNELLNAGFWVAHRDEYCSTLLYPYYQF